MSGSSLCCWPRRRTWGTPCIIISHSTDQLRIHNCYVIADIRNARSTLLVLLIANAIGWFRLLMAAVTTGVHVLKSNRSSVARFEGNRYSVPAGYAGHNVFLRAYVDRVDIAHGERIIASHPRSYGRGQDILDPYHYVPVPA